MARTRNRLGVTLPVDSQPNASRQGRWRVERSRALLCGGSALDLHRER